jgi:UDPglucose 6-dehydrogenase
VRTVEIGLDLLDGSYHGAKVAALGAAFKPNSDDIRDSPALDVAAAIGRREGDVVVYDPQAVKPAQAKHPELSYAASLEDALDGADIVFLLTEWDEFRYMHPGVVGKLVKQRKIVDGRNVLDPKQWRAAGWQYRALGRP